MTYDAFISYSHAADGQLAPALQRGLQRLAKPWNRRRALDIFRDETGLSTNPHLWSSVQAALDNSEWFILLASPEAAASDWVNKEIEHWLATKSFERILPVVTNGTWLWSKSSHDFTADAAAVPRALRGAFVDEPRHLDLRWARSETDLDLRNTRFRDAVADLAAPMHGLPKDELEGEDIRHHRRAIRLARSAVIGLVALLAASLTVGIYAFIQRDHATTNARLATERATIADAERLAAQATGVARTRLDLALLLAVEGHRLKDLVSTRKALLQTLSTNSGARLLRAYRNFGEGVTAGAVSPDGKLGVAAERGGTRLQFFDVGHRAALGAPVAIDRVVTAAFSPDGKLVATGAANGMIRLWDPRLAQPIGPVIQHGSGALALEPAALGLLAFSPDHGVLCSLSQSEQTLSCWLTTTGAALAAAIRVPDPREIAFSPDGRFLAVASGGATSGAPPDSPEILIIDAKTYRPTRRLEADASDIAISTDGRTLAAGETDGEISVWDLGKADGPRTFTASDRELLDLVISPDGTKLITSSVSRQVQVWDLSTGKTAGPSLVGFSDLPVGLVLPDNRTLLTLSATEVTTWRLGRVPLLDDQAGSQSPIGSSPDGSTVILYDEANRALQALDSSTQGSQLASMVFEGDLVEVGANSGKSNLLYAVVRPSPSTATAEKRALVFDVHTGDLRANVPLAADTTITDISPDGRRFLCVRTPTPSPNAPNGLDLSGEVRQLDIASATQTAPVSNLPNEFSPPRYSPDGRAFIVASPGADVRRFSTRTQRLVVRYRHPQGDVLLPTIARYSPDGGFVAAASGNQVQLLDGHSLTPIGPTFVTDAVTGIALSPDSRLLATASGSLLTLWDIKSHQSLAELDLEGTSTGLVGFLGTRSTALVAAAGERLRSLDLSPEHWVQQACQLADRALTRQEWKQYIRNRPYSPVCKQRLLDVSSGRPR